MAKRSETDKAIRNIMNWAARSDWGDYHDSVMSEHLLLISDHLGMSQSELMDQIEANGYGSVLFGIVFEDFLTRRFGGDQKNIVEDYLKRRGWRESVPGRRYLQAVQDSVLSLYEIVDITPGKHCDLVDLVRGGEPIRVYERTGTQQLVKWDKVAARVLNLNRKNIFSGGVLPFSPEDAQALLDDLEGVRIRSELVPGPSSDQSPLQISASLFTTAWINSLFVEKDAALPEMVNADGEALQFCETRFPYEANQRDEIIRRLEADPEWECDASDGSLWVWFSSSKTATKKPSKGISFETLQEGQRPTSGTLNINTDACLLSTNSQERSERGQKVLAQLLDGLVGVPLSVLQTPEQAMAEHDDDEDEGEELDPAAVADMIHRHMDRHYRKCLDDTIPILDNKSPRECVKTAAGRKKVIDWLKLLENSELRRVAIEGEKPYDMAWMWDELGLDR